ncbi:MAG: hypothetical protein ACHQIM_02580 [Sphingobacteriales bacterium]
MKFKKRTFVKLSPFKRILAVFMAQLILFDAVMPRQILALTGGPSQPEVESFEPVSTTQMVDPFTGAFNYNIPLLDIDGYPVNISYHSGVTMDQEASWVGLGWNISPGVINRGLRGLPDDFNGDPITKEFNVRANRTFGVTGTFAKEVFGLDPKVFLQSKSISVGIKYNYYNGVGIEATASATHTGKFNSGKSGKTKNTYKLGLTVETSSDDGLTIEPSGSFSSQIRKKGFLEGADLGAKVGLAFNSRAGLKSLSISAFSSGKVNSNIKTKKHPGGIESGQKELAGASFDLGTHSYTPDIQFPMNNLSISAKFSWPGALSGVHPNYTISGYYSGQTLQTNSITRRGYGYMNSDQGQNDDNAMLDFNREKDGNFTPNTPLLPQANLTYDVFSVMGQGIGGSYRPYRNDVGYVFDPYTNTTSDGYNFGAEVGAGDVFHIGADVTINDSYSESGRWTEGNDAAPFLTYKTNPTGDPAYEKYYFKEASEKTVSTDQQLFSNLVNISPAYVDLNEVSSFNTHAANYLVYGGGNHQPLPATNFRQGKEKRNQTFSFLTRQELKQGVGVNYVNPQSYNAPNHHIAEVTCLGDGGQRYVYGIAAYNTRQEETSFAIGADIVGNGGNVGDCNSGLVGYAPSADNSISNVHGLDHYYSNTIMPAYAHSYLLTSVLSPDYVDADTIKGPSDGDLGTWVKFHYSKISGYNWRVPFEHGMASYNEGLKSDQTDDKASYLYGEKELWYLDSIVTKNHIAIFQVEDRKDAYGVIDKNGGLNNASPTKLLRKISLYSRPDYKQNGVNAIPLKEVHFEYDYSLCGNVPNNNGVSEIVNGRDMNRLHGKLTLQKIYFTYQSSQKARFSPYTFGYASNPSYNLKGYDRWGNFKPNTGTACSPRINAPLPTSEFPYVDQDTAKANLYMASWSLNQVLLPSGGTININYESNDYAYVQNKRAMQMFKIVDIEDNTPGSPITPNPPGTEKSLSSIGFTNKYLVFELQPGYTNISDYFSGIDNLYFRCLMKMNINPPTYDYVSGYSPIENGNNFGTVPGTDGKTYGWVKLKGVPLKKILPINYNPISKAAIQFGRLHLSRVINTLPGVTGTEGVGGQIIKSLLAEITNFTQWLEGPNQAIWDLNKGRDAVMGKSWIRLNNPNHKKLGGGARVKQLLISDQWNGMTASAMNSFDYGQQFDYTMPDGTSSGVATYEPMLGGDENPWRQPLFFDVKNLLAPDDQFYEEGPVFESQFPSPGIGYRRVAVQNLKRANVTRHATGKVVHEFYTAFDFPTIPTNSYLKNKEDKTGKYSILNLLHIKSRDYMTATQGFCIELNDMHGKPKKESVYAEDKTVPISSLEYRYKQDVVNNRILNGATVINPDGSVGSADIGLFFDVAADMRQDFSHTESVSLELNDDDFFIGPIPLPFPFIWPSIYKDETQFRSITTNKVVQRFGILEETIATDLGSTVATKNLAYDSQTGEVLLTRTTTNFNDSIFSLKYPAYWYYNQMGMAYHTLGVNFPSLSFSNLGVAPVTNSGNYFSIGDEVSLANSSGTAKYGWVTDISSGAVTVVDKKGNPVPGTYAVKVIRSGRRNMQSMPMESATTLVNPLTSFSSNLFQNVIQASAIEYSDNWRTQCDCYGNVQANTLASTNPYILGRAGNWRPSRNFAYLTSRALSHYDNNTNIRRDGVFTSFSPYYSLSAAKWTTSPANWTFASEITEFNPFGGQIEERDALGRYASQTFGYNQSLVTANASNSRFSEMGFDGFEDYAYSICADNHFKFPRSGLSIVNTESHTGEYSLKVSSANPVSLYKVMTNCAKDSCTLVLSKTGTVDFTTVTISGGTLPYQIDYTIISGTPSISENSSLTSISIHGSHWTVQVVVTDSKGCRQIQTISQ